MQQAHPKILFDCERMKYPHTGLYHFCWELGQELIAQSEGTGIEIDLYAKKKVQQQFASRPGFLEQSALHKFLMPNLDQWGLWHATHQATDYYPGKDIIATVLTVHDLNFLHETYRSNQKKARERDKLQRKLDKADSVVAISEFVAKDLRENMQLDPTKLQVIYNGCNIKTTKTLAEPRIKPRGEFLFTIGTVLPKKNFQTLPALLQNNDMQLLIAGAIHDKQSQQLILDQAFVLGVADRVIFTGPISEAEKYWYYQHCRAFVFPSLMEGFGLPVVEAMAFGKPLFLSTLTSLPEIGGNLAYYFQSFDPEQMQMDLKVGLSNYDANPAFVAKIILRSQEFSWKASAKSYLATYQQILNQR
ncbi:MAG: group 1 glycosyl transferase [Chitinophagaceae bacterium BSSC1]|nr:MAG: group 1 glycosyl transferase [Chitinophagaceae bacterium BSSC1]